jgi:hypothetical protein
MISKILEFFLYYQSSKTLSRIISVSLAGWLLIGGIYVVSAQNNTNLIGTVTDETGGVITGIEVILADNKNHKYSAYTDERGRYQFDRVPPGKYNLTVFAEGFEGAIQQLDLTKGGKTSFDVTLKIIISEQLEINSNSDSLSAEPDKNLSAIVITEKELAALPDDPDELLQALREMAGGSGGLEDATVFVDGFREGGRMPPKESILRIRINTNPFSAEYSEPGVSRIEVVTKPGSDKYHGGFRLNFNDESLNARNAFNLRRPSLQIRTFSGNVSGPLIKNRWGFFLDVDRRDQDENETINANALDPITLTPRPFVTTVSTPNRNNNFQFRTDFQLSKKHTLGFSYRYGNNSAENEGLSSGFDLPERAFERTTRDNTMRFSLTSIVNESMVNEMRLELNRRTTRVQSLNDAPAILVLDAFNAGGNQSSLFTNNRNSNLEFAETVSYTRGKHTFKMGSQIEITQLENISRSNFGGTFTFGSDFERDSSGNIILDNDGQPTIIIPLEHYRRTLLGLPGYQPSQFSIVRGDPFIGFTQSQFSYFFQDDWRLSPNLTLSYGVRQEMQTHLDDKLNFAPRLGLAWSPDKKRQSTVRVGVGLFYNRLDTGITNDTIRLDGQHQQQLVITRPTFFSNIPPQFDNAVARVATIRQKADGLNASYSMLGTVSYERQLPAKLTASVNYSWQRGIHLLRTRNINAPLRQADGSIARPFADQGPILQYESTGYSIRHELRVSLRSNFNRKFSFFSNYTLSSTRSDTDGAFTSPADPYDLTNEFGRSSQDQRHRVFIGGSVTLPGNLRLSPFFFAASGAPFNITTGRDNNGDTLFVDRPSFAQIGDPGAVVTEFGIFNPNPLPGQQLIPRNFGNGPSQARLNLNISRTFGFGPKLNDTAGGPPSGGQMRERGGFGGSGNRGGGGGFGGGGFGGGDSNNRYNLTLSINIQNLFNRTNLANFNGVLSSPLFGKANRAIGARRVEMALRFNF